MAPRNLRVASARDITLKRTYPPGLVTLSISARASSARSKT